MSVKKTQKAAKRRQIKSGTTSRLRIKHARAQARKEDPRLKHQAGSITAVICQP